MKIVINAAREAYGLEDVKRTMTIGEIVAYLQDNDPDTPVYLSFDGGYTYGGLEESFFEEVDDDDADDNEEDA